MRRKTQPQIFCDSAAAAAIVVGVLVLFLLFGFDRYAMLCVLRAWALLIIFLYLWRSVFACSFSLSLSRPLFLFYRYSFAVFVWLFGRLDFSLFACYSVSTFSPEFLLLLLFICLLMFSNNLPLFAYGIFMVFVSFFALCFAIHNAIETTQCKWSLVFFHAIPLNNWHLNIKLLLNTLFSHSFSLVDGCINYTCTRKCVEI